MELDEFHSLYNNEIEPHLWIMRAWAAINALGIKPKKDGNKWCFVYGGDLLCDISGFGETIEEAAENFYTDLLTKRAY